MVGEVEGLISAFLVWSASYVSAESLEREGSILSSCFYWQLADYYSGVFSLIHPVYQLGGVQDSQHQWWKTPQTFHLKKVFYNFVPKFYTHSLE